MIIVQKPTSPISDVGILLGRQGENKARQIEFDLSWLIEEYGEGTAVLVHQRSKDGAPYICTATQDGSVLTWTLNNLDTAYDGWGQAELRWTVGDVLAKTLVYKTMVVRSITSDAEMPDPYESWYDQMIDYINENAVTYQELGQAIEDYIEEHPISAPVQSVNGKTGTVVLTASDVGAGTYSKPSGGIPASDIASGVIPAIDATLSITGKAADAKATGDAIALKANTNSPSFTGTPKAPTASTSTSNTEIASTAFVHNVVTSELGRLDDVWSGTCATAASTAAKVVAIDGTGIDLSTNPIIVVYFSKGNSASTPTIKLGSNGTAYPIHYQTNNGTSTEQMNSANMLCYWGIGVRIFKFVSNKWIDVMPDMYHIYTMQNELSDKYEKPSGGIPSSDMTSAVQTSLGLADSAYQKPSGGIPSTDMSSAVQSSLGKADTALQSAPVSSVNTKTGAVSLDAGDIGYDDSETYTSGSVGAELTSLKGDITDKLDAPSSAGTSGQVLATDGDGGTYWTNQSGGSVSPYTSTPAALGTASAGSSNDYSRGDHVHPMPSAANVGAIALPVSPSSGDFLVYNGSAWVAQSLSTWSGGNY